MLLPVPEIFLDRESSKLCTEIKDLEARVAHLQQQAEAEDQACSHLNKSIDTLEIQIPHIDAQLGEMSNKIAQHYSKLELKCREAAHAKEFIATQHAEQATLDALALRFESDCLQAEERLQASENFEESIKSEYWKWSFTENERKEAVGRAAKEGENQSQEIAELRRQLEAFSLEAAAAAQASILQTSNTITANLQVENITKALNAAQEEAAVLRRRLDQTELALAERTAALKMEARSAISVEKDLLKALKHVEKARKDLDSEITAGKELSVAAADAERKRIQVEKQAAAAHGTLQTTLQDTKLAEMELRQHKLASKQTESDVKDALLQAGHSARSLAESLEKHRELEEAIAVQETEQKSFQHHSALVSHVKAIKHQNKTLDKNLAELSKQKIRLQQETEARKKDAFAHETTLRGTQAQSHDLDIKADKLREQLQHHEEALYRVDFQILVAKRAAAVVGKANEGCVSAGTWNNNEISGESLRLLKQELQTELDNARITHRKQVRTVWEVEEAAKKVGVAADDLQQKSNTLSQQQKIEEVALKTAENKLHTTKMAKEDVQMAVDRAEMALSRSKDRFSAKAKAVLELSAMVQQGDVSFQTRARELENKVQELSADHHVALNALQDPKSVLTSRNVAVSTATAALSTLQLKTQQASPSGNEKERTKKTASSGCVAGVCAEMRRQVEELQASLTAAEADCDVLEQALTAQKLATATANNHT